MKIIRSGASHLFFFTVLFTGFSINGTAQTLFSKAIGTNKQEEFNRAILTSDHSAIAFVGDSKNNVAPYENGALFGKVDTSGNLLWMFRFQSMKEEKQKLHLYDILETPDDGFLLAGTLDKAHDNGVFIKTNSSGQIEWYMRYQPFGDHFPGEQFLHAIITPDEGYAAIGFNGAGSNDLDLMWIRVDQSGNLLYSHRLGNSKNDYPISLFRNGNEGYYLVSSVGNLDTDPGNDVFPRVYRLDTAGHIIWSRNIFLKFPGNVTDCIQTSDGGYVMTGNGLSQSYLMKLDAAFNFQWMKKYPLAGFRSITQDTNENFLIASAIDSATYNWQNKITRTDPLGNVQYSKIVGSNNITYYSSINVFSVTPGLTIWMDSRQGIDPFTTNDIAIFNSGTDGQTNCISINQPLMASEDLDSLEHYDSLFISESITMEVKSDELNVFTEDTQSELCMGVPTGSTALKNDAVVRVYPNPANQFLNIQFDSEWIKNEEPLKIYDCLGRLVWINVIQSDQKDILHIPVNDWAKGLYFFQINSISGKILSEKFEVN